MVQQGFLSEIDPVGIILLDSIISCTITVQQIQGGGGSLMVPTLNCLPPRFLPWNAPHFLPSIIEDYGLQINSSGSIIIPVAFGPR